MNNKVAILAQLKKQVLLPLFYDDNPDVCVEVVKALYSAGIRAIEFTNRGAAAVANFEQIVQVCKPEMSDLYMGIGTIKTPAQMNDFLNAGADFFISPIFDKTISDAANQANIFWIPGCMTPTEIAAAEQSGCQLIKLFPGNVLGTAFLESIKPIFPAVDFMLTGGVKPTKENLSNWLQSGVLSVIGMGSNLIQPTLIAAKNYTEIEKNTRLTLALINALKT